MAEKPSVLIIGGLGYIGRFLALHIHQNELASDVRLVDKVLPQLAWLAPEFSEACSQDKFMQADASRPGEFLHCLLCCWLPRLLVQVAPNYV
jgi:nucleoside-diphosphate-sugar epimerase